MKRCLDTKRSGNAASCWAAGGHSTIRLFAITVTKTCPSGDAACSSRPASWLTGKLVTNDLVDINLGLRILLGSSYYDDWQNEETFVKTDPLGNAIDKRHPWNQTTTPRPQKRDFNGNYTWVMSPRWFDKRTGDHLRARYRRRPNCASVVDSAFRAGGHRLHQGHRAIA